MIYFSFIGESWKVRRINISNMVSFFQAFVNLSEQKQIFLLWRQNRINGCALLPFYFHLLSAPITTASEIELFAALKWFISSEDCSFGWKVFRRRMIQECTGRKRFYYRVKLRHSLSYSDRSSSSTKRHKILPPHTRTMKWLTQFIFSRPSCFSFLTTNAW